MDIAKLIRANRAARRRAATRIESLDAELVDLVNRGLAAGIGATDLAQIAGVSRARVYQIRDGRR